MTETHHGAVPSPAAIAVLEAEGLVREFREGASTLRVLDGLSMRIERGESVAIVCASGSGKTTLLQILGGLDRPTEGTVRIDGRDIHALDETARCALRNRTLGFIYQFHHLLPEFSAPRERGDAAVGPTHGRSRSARPRGCGARTGRARGATRAPST